MVTTQEVNTRAKEWGMPEVVARDGFKTTLKRVRTEVWSTSGSGGKKARLEKMEEIKDKPFPWPKFTTGNNDLLNWLRRKP